MKSYTIKVNGLHVSGLDGNYGRMVNNSRNCFGYDTSGSGISVSNNELDGVIVQGNRNLKSYIDKIMNIEGVEIGSFEFNAFKKG